MNTLTIETIMEEINDREFQPATVDHIQFVFESILREARAGHFNEDFTIPAAQQGLLFQIESSIRHHSAPPSMKPSSIFVLSHDGMPVGFSWIREYENGRPGDFEIYLFAVSPESRGKGFGGTMLDESIKQFSASKLRMRLYHASAQMLKMATKRGFKRSIKQGRHTINLWRNAN